MTNVSNSIARYGPQWIARLLNFERTRLLQLGVVIVCALGLKTSTLNASPPNLIANATTTNQSAVAIALDNVAATSTGSLSTLINSLAASTPSQQQQSFNQLSGEMFGSTQTIGLQVGDQFLQRIGNRLISNGQFLAGAPASQTVESTDSSKSPFADANSIWIQGYGVGGSLHSDGNGAGVRYSQGGGLYGMDLAGDESEVFGIAGGNSYVGFHDGLGGFGQLNAYQVGLYALKQDDVAYVLGTTNYGYDSFGSTRNVSVGGVDQSLRGNFAAHQLGVYAETGLNLHAGWVHIQPLLGIQYLYLAQQGIGETGGSAALNVSAAQANSLRTSLGGRIVVDQLHGPMGTIWTPYWQYRWVSELLDNDRSITASLVGSPIGGAFITHGTQLGHNYLNIGKGLQAQLTEQWSFFGLLDLMTDGRLNAESASLGLVYTW